MKTIIAAAACAFVASTAAAQESGWQYKLTTYIWATDTGVTAETPSGSTVSAELSFSDALSDLDFAFMGALEARKGRLSLFTDGLYFKLSPTNPTPLGILADDVTVRTQMTIITGMAGYRTYEDQNLAIDVAGGFRWAKLDSDVLFTNPTAPLANFNTSDSWADPVIGVRFASRLSDRVTATLYADYGGFSSDSSTWQVSATMGYDLNERWTLVGGYRYMEFEREIDGRDFQFDQGGILLGAALKF